MTVVTVNKVQDLYNTPIYKVEGKSDEEDLLLIMNEYFRNDINYDLDHYQKKFFESVHVGDFVLENKCV
jgi:hypothetical protein